jgi:hypothetical protein
VRTFSIDPFPIGVAPLVCFPNVFFFGHGFGRPNYCVPFGFFDVLGPSLLFFEVRKHHPFLIGVALKLIGVKVSA